MKNYRRSVDIKLQRFIYNIMGADKSLDWINEETFVKYQEDDKWCRLMKRFITSKTLLELMKKCKN